MKSEETKIRDNLRGLWREYEEIKRLPEGSCSPADKVRFNFLAKEIRKMQRRLERA